MTLVIVNLLIVPERTILLFFIVPFKQLTLEKPIHQRANENLISPNKGEIRNKNRK